MTNRGYHMGASPASRLSAVALPQYEALVTAIIARAVSDYKRALGGEWEEIFAWIAKPNKEECERFFRSEWFELLTGLNGEWFIEQIRKEVGYVEPSDG